MQYEERFMFYCYQLTWKNNSCEALYSRKGIEGEDGNQNKEENLTSATHHWKKLTFAILTMYGGTCPPQQSADCISLLRHRINEQSKCFSFEYYK